MLACYGRLTWANQMRCSLIPERVCLGMKRDVSLLSIAEIQHIQRRNSIQVRTLWARSVSTSQQKKGIFLLISLSLIPSE